MSAHAPIAAWVDRAARAHDAVTRGGYLLATALLAVIVCAYCWEVIARYLFNAPTTWASALVSYALCAIIFLAAPELTRRNVHIVINILLDRLPPRTVVCLQRLIAAAGAATCLSAAWIVATVALAQYRQGVETILTWAVPKWPLSALIAYGLLSSGVYFLRRAAGGAQIQAATVEAA